MRGIGERCGVTSSGEVGNRLSEIEEHISYRRRAGRGKNTNYAPVLFNRVSFLLILNTVVTHI